MQQDIEQDIATVSQQDIYETEHGMASTYGGYVLQEPLVSKQLGRRRRRQAVIVGANAAGEFLARELQNTKWSRMNILGYISEDTNQRASKDGLPILNDRATLRHLAQSGMIDMIIMAIDYKGHPDLFQEAIEATQFGIPVLPMAQVYENIRGKIPLEHIGDQWSLVLPEESISPLYLCWREILDIAFGLLGMLILILILPILVLLIYCDSPGPIFYKQERLGHHGRKFFIYKFRSMKTDAEQGGRAVWTSDDDPRITAIGRLMRKTHLDELPQVFNILRGEMSLIGPRPEREEFVIELEKTIPFYRCRLMIKPGLSGWAQVKYHYARSDEETLEKLQYDLYYIKHRSYMLDIIIILKTIGEVLSCH